MTVSEVIAAILPYAEPLVVSAGLLVVAVLVNWVARERRRELRRAVVLFVIYLVAKGLSFALQGAASGALHTAVDVVGQLMLAFLAVHLAAILILDVGFASAGIAVAGIISDVGIGFAYAVAFGLVLSNAGFDPTSVVAASTLFAAVLTISLQSTLGNVIGGAALQLDGSVQPGDWLQLENGREGRVRQIRWRHAVLEMRNGGLLIVPNSVLLASQIVILGKRGGTPIQHRYEVTFHVDFRFAPGTVIQVVQEALRASPIANTAAAPAPDCLCVDFARDGRESYAVYLARYWLTDLAQDDPTASAVRSRLFAALKRAHIPLARPALMLFYAPRGDETSAREIADRRERSLAALARVDLFRPLTPDELERTADRLLPAPFAAGEVMTHQGAVAHWLYLLLAGTAEVRLTADGAVRTVATLTGPCLFGEMGLLTGDPRQASVVATSDCECYRLDKESFGAVVRERPELAAELSSLVAHRRAQMRGAIDVGDPAANQLEAHEREQLVHRVRDFFGLAL